MPAPCEVPHSELEFNDYMMTIAQLRVLRRGQHEGVWKRLVGRVPDDGSRLDLADIHSPSTDERNRLVDGRRTCYCRHYSPILLRREQ